MHITELLRRLKAPPVSARVAETRKLEDGTTIYIVVARLPDYPFGREKYVWYPITIDPTQNEIIDRDEIRAMLAHFWHSGLDFFADDAGPPLVH